jgi:hypothetical protein
MFLIPKGQRHQLPGKGVAEGHTSQTFPTALPEFLTREIFLLRRTILVDGLWIHMNETSNFVDPAWRR